MFGAVTSNAMNDYSGSLAVQAAGIRIRRNWSAALGTLLAFLLILWLSSGNLSTKFQNILLFTAYWIAPFLAVIVIDWYQRRGTISTEGLARLMAFKNLSMGWQALAALLVGFAAMVPFMNSGLFIGPVANAFHGADLSFYVGFAAAAIAYSVLHKLQPDVAPDRPK